MSQALSVTICPDTVLLFEPRMRYPALRVTAMNFLFRNARFYCKFTVNFDKKFEIFNFFIFFIFGKNFAIRNPQFQPTNKL